MEEANCQHETLFSGVKGNSYERFQSDIFRSDFRIVGHVAKRISPGFRDTGPVSDPDLTL